MMRVRGLEHSWGPWEAGSFEVVPIGLEHGSLEAGGLEQVCVGLRTSSPEAPDLVRGMGSL